MQKKGSMTPPGRDNLDKQPPLLWIKVSSGWKLLGSFDPGDLIHLALRINDEMGIQYRLDTYSDGTIFFWTTDEVPEQYRRERL